MGPGSKPSLDHLEEVSVGVLSYLILSYHLEEGLGSWGAHLEHDGEDGEDDDLDGGPARVPVGAADPVLECD